MAVADGVAVDGIFATSPVEVIGVNDRVQLAELERAYQQQQVARADVSRRVLRRPSSVLIFADPDGWA